MRTLKLSHEKIELILQALGIAEKKFSDIQKDITENTILVRGVNSPTSTAKEKENTLYHDKSCKFADLNIEIQEGTFDL